MYFINELYGSGGSLVSESYPTHVTPWTVAHQLLCPWDFPGKNTGVGCYFLFQVTFLSQTQGQTCVSCIGRWILYHWATREAQWIAYLPSKYHSWTCNLLSEAVFTWNINSFVKHFEDPMKITNDLSVSTFFFPEKCKAIGNSTFSLTTVCSLHFIQWEWFYGITFETRIFKPLENF